LNRPGIALQLYSVREATAKDFKGTLRKVAEMGYEGVEFAGYGGFSAEQLREWLDELKLKAVGSHVGLADLRNDPDAVASFNRKIGSPYVVCPSLPHEGRSDESWREQFVELERIGNRLRDNGLRFGYHNHAFEFTIKLGGETLFDALFSATSPESVFVELDVCWAQAAGYDPIRYAAKYSGRLPLVHLKDYVETEGKVRSVELGRGAVDMKGVIAESIRSGAEWLIVEQEHFDGDPLESVARSAEWLKAAVAR